MKTSRREMWFIVILTLAGTALRIADLTGRSLWIDESLTLSRIIGSWSDVFRNIVVMQGVRTIDLHPPLYFAILKATGILLGDSEFTLKLVGAFASILLIPATYVLGRRLFSGRVGLLAAVLACFSPAYQWYGHELRMYTVVALLAALSDYALFAAAQSSKLNVRRWVVWLCITVSALFTHYSVVGLFTFQVLFAIAVILYKRPHITRRDIFIFGGIVLGLVSISLLAGVGGDIIFRIRQLTVGATLSAPVTNPLGDIVQNVFNTMLFGMNASDPTDGLLTWFVVLVAIVGLLLPASFAVKSVDHRSSRLPRIFLAVVTIFPMIFVLLYYLIEHQPSFRYSILIVPAIHILLARSFSIGLVQLRNMIVHATALYRSSHRRMALRLSIAIVGVVALFAVMSAQLFGMAYTFIQTPTWQDDWRGMALYIRDNWQPGDVLVITLYTPEEELRRLLKDVPMPIIPVQMLPVDDQARQKMIGSYRRVWFANTGGVELDMRSTVGRTFLPLHRRERVSFPGQTNVLDLMLFEIAPDVMSAAPAGTHLVQQDAAPSDVPDVVAYDVQPGDPFHQHPNMRLSLFWRRPADQREIGVYSVGFRLKTADQRVWADWFLPSRLEQAPSTWHGG
ncbi:MAG TPA: glycosyltransferase family 39 protein, partial [Anaerolineae bacterium]